MTFPIDNVYLDMRVASGSTWGLEDEVVDKTAGNGLPEVNPLLPRPKRSWLFSWPRKLSVDNVETCFEIRGNHRGFLLVPRRQRDYICTDQVIGEGDGVETTFRFKVTRSDAGGSLVIPVLRLFPLLAGGITPTFKLDDTPLLSGFTVNYTSPATVTFDVAPGDGVEIKSTFWRAWAARFKSTKIDTTVYHENHQEMRSVTMEEVFENEA